jgi:hypothetical protein
MASKHRSVGTISAVVAAVALASVPLSFTGPEALRLAVIGPFLLAGPGTALILLLKPARIRKGTGFEVLPLAVAMAVSLLPRPSCSRRRCSAPVSGTHRRPCPSWPC